MKFTLRLFIVLAYCLPFVFFMMTCNSGLNLKVAYNKKQAALNMQEQAETVTAADSRNVDTSINAIPKGDSLKRQIITEQIFTDSLATEDKDDLSVFQKGARLAIFPTESSLSAVGSIWFFKNIIGRYFIGASLLLSLISLIFYRFLRSKKFDWYLQIGNLLLVAAFIMDCFLSEVSLLWGAWMLLILLVFQVTISFYDRKHYD